MRACYRYLRSYEMMNAPSTRSRSSTTIVDNDSAATADGQTKSDNVKRNSVGVRRRQRRATPPPPFYVPPPPREPSWTRRDKPIAMPKYVTSSLNDDHVAHTSLFAIEERASQTPTAGADSDERYATIMSGASASSLRRQKTSDDRRVSRGGAPVVVVCGDAARR